MHHQVCARALGSRSYPSLSFLGTTNPTVQASLLVPPHSRAFRSAGTTSMKIKVAD